VSVRLELIAGHHHTKKITSEVQLETIKDSHWHIDATTEITLEGPLNSGWSPSHREYEGSLKYLFLDGILEHDDKMIHGTEDGWN